MAATILDCHEVSEKIIQRCTHQLHQTNTPKATLAIVIVGSCAASRTYINLKLKCAQRVGLDTKLVELPEQITQHELEDALTSLSEDDEIYGIVLQLPIPLSLQTTAALEKIAPHKDVDGLTAHNLGALLRGEEGIIPCTPLGIMRILEHFKIPTQGKQAVIVGRSTLVGLPQMLLLARKTVDATVTLCHSATENLDEICRTADILISATGILGLISEAHIKPGATVIDVGITQTPEGIRGDIQFNKAMNVAGRITPMPGGTGPVTVACLIENSVKQVVTTRQ